MKLRLFSAAAALGAAILLAPAGSAQEFPYQIFERYLEPLAQQIGMPGLSAVIARNGIVEWERGYGHADLEAKIAATPDTPYPIGGVTQAMTGVLLGICVDRLQLRVDEKIRDYVPTFPVAGATVRQVLAHASEGHYKYDPLKFVALTAVVEKCSARPYRVATADELLTRLTMTSSAPGLDLARDEGQAARLLFEPGPLARYDGVLGRVAVPYRIDRKRNAVRSEYPSYGLDAAGGLVASARDLAGFDRDLDQGVPLSFSTLNQMWSNAIIEVSENNFVTMPTGLGWFVQSLQAGTDKRLVWSYGYIPDAGSALIMKMPHKRLTLILLSNSDGLAAGYGLERGDVSASPFVKIFLRLFL
ncbi:MAG: serine hydrolase domain-containing protein [Vicinamibacterales bacterium]|nr:serine hydrolase domain-containing protein [Vicinamibacterales bacterium]